MYTVKTLLSRDITMLKLYGITAIYQPMFQHIFSATSIYEPVRQYINPAKWAVKSNRQNLVHRPERIFELFVQNLNTIFNFKNI